MLREISEEVRVNIKDRLRDVRHAIRQHRHDTAAAPQGAESGPRAPFPVRELEGLFGRAASAVDDVMSIAETFVPRRPGSRVNAPAPKALGVYFPTGRNAKAIAGERAFRHDFYAAIKAVLADKKLAGTRVREASLATAHADIARRHPDLIARLGAQATWAERVPLVATLTSALLIELLNHNPLRPNEQPLELGPGPLDRSTVIACLAPAALACGLATMEDGGAEQDDLLEIAMLAADARRDRILEACNGREPLQDLTAVFATLLAHLP
jgi:hypothetical protein